MFNSTVLEVAIGLIFCFSAVSLIVSSVNEGISSFLKLRGKYLLSGLKILLNDPAARHLVLDLYNHARFNPGSKGKVADVKQLHGLPSYIDPRQFATALSDILNRQAGGTGDFAAAIAGIQDAQLQEALQAMYVRAGADLQRFEAEVAYWFDHAMDRLAGQYKRTMQWLTLLIGFVLAVAMNIDALHLFKVLWAHPALMLQVDTATLVDAHSAMANLTVTTLPIGWEAPPFSHGKDGWSLTYDAGVLAQMGAGWAITASSTLFGSPFWFDLLQKVTHLRGTGPKVN